MKRLVLCCCFVSHANGRVVVVSLNELGVAADGVCIQIGNSTLINIGSSTYLTKGEPHNGVFGAFKWGKYYNLNGLSILIG